MQHIEPVTPTPTPHWQHAVLTTGSPGKSPNKWFLNTGNFYVIYKEQKWNLLQPCTHISTFLQASLSCWPKSTDVASTSLAPQCSLADNHHLLSPQGPSLLLSSQADNHHLLSLQGPSLLLSSRLAPCSISHFLFPVFSMLSCSGCVIFAAYSLTLKWVFQYTDVLKHQIIWRTYWLLSWL